MDMRVPVGKVWDGVDGRYCRFSLDIADLQERLREQYGVTHTPSKSTRRNVGRMEEFRPGSRVLRALSPRNRTVGEFPELGVYNPMAPGRW